MSWYEYGQEACSCSNENGLERIGHGGLGMGALARGPWQGCGKESMGAPDAVDAVDAGDAGSEVDAEARIRRKVPTNSTISVAVMKGSKERN